MILPIWMDTMGVFYAEAASQLIGGLACFATITGEGLQGYAHALELLGERLEK